MLATDRVPAIFWETNRIGRAARRGLAGRAPLRNISKRGASPLMRDIAGILAATLFPMFALTSNVNAVELITNGGFEAGLTGWTVTSSVGSGGSWSPDTTSSTPLTGNPTVGPFSGTGYAVTDQFGPGVNALSQDYTVPAGTTSLTLTFDMFINDWAGSAGHESLDVLILGAGANPVTGSGTTLISTDTLVTGGVPNPYIAHDFAITGFVPGDTYILDYPRGRHYVHHERGPRQRLAGGSGGARAQQCRVTARSSRGHGRYWPAPARGASPSGKASLRLGRDRAVEPTGPCPKSKHSPSGHA